MKTTFIQFSMKIQHQIIVVVHYFFLVSQVNSLLFTFLFKYIKDGNLKNDIVWPSFEIYW